tara:strand:+ start:5368 stop:7434 length:2067 start_codon:yes stop_codon:yes gene_type:complete
MDTKPEQTLNHHIEQVLGKKRKFENVFESVSRMILDNDNAFEKRKVNGKTTYDYSAFRQGKKHLIAMYDEINSLVAFIKDATEGGSSQEMAYVLVGEPGNGKTFFVEYLCSLYRNFISQEENRRFTFQFTNLDKLNDKYGGISEIESQTFEDPMILAMNLFEGKDRSLEHLSEIGFDDKGIEGLTERYRPLGACSDYILNDIRELTDGDVEKILEFIKVKPIKLSETLGTLTGKYSARDKITSSAKDLLGEESVQRLLHIRDTNNPYRIDLRIGALARVAGGGIHFSDELFKNKKDLVQVYLGVIQNRNIEIDGFKWPIDTFIIATSNNDEFNRFREEQQEAPIIDRCRVCYVGHNTNYQLQNELTEYALGSGPKTTMAGESLHRDPNLIHALSVASVLTRLPKSDKLTPIEMMKLAAGEVAGEKSIKTLTEVIDTLKRDSDITRRFGQRGIGHRNLGRSMQFLIESSETQEGQCIYAEDVFNAFEQVILDYVTDQKLRGKFIEDLGTAKTLYRERVMTTMFNAYMDEPSAIRNDVMNYVNMIIGIDAEDLGTDNMWKYRDPQTGELKAIQIDKKYVESVEERLGLKNEEQKESFRTTIRKIYGQKVSTEPEYNFMDNNKLVKAVTDVRLQSDVAGAKSLVGALANRTNEENRNLYSRIIETMIDKLDYCKTCAQKTIEYFCTHENEA